MAVPELRIHRCSHRLLSDDRRVITRLFAPGDEHRIRSIIDRILSLSDEQTDTLLHATRREFVHRHRHLDNVWMDHFGAVRNHVDQADSLSDKKRLLIGAFFTMEYSIESAALFNPSIVPLPEHGDTPRGAMRFLMSLRATGEGHVSSIVFRTGTIGADGNVEIDPISPYVHGLKPVDDQVYDKATFFLQLIEMGGYSEQADRLLEPLPDDFMYRDLEAVIAQQRPESDQDGTYEEASDTLLRLARSNYMLRLPSEIDPSEVVIFPASEHESRGMEDMRLVRFVDDDGQPTYFGTYTAYNGFTIMPQLMETREFQTFQMTTLRGRYVRNKGLALFPRRLDGWYAMISRLDGENLYLMRSKNIRFWNDAQLIQAPQLPWELVQIGNCGSPLETDEGWLLLTHGVGPMRRYCMGATLLDRDDPSRLIGMLEEPLLAPNASERDGYVPNVVYSCGAVIHGDHLIIPYAMSDSATSVARVSVSELLGCLKQQ